MHSILKEHKGFGKQILILAKNELIKTYKGAAIGPAWALIKPAFTLFVYWFAFTIGLRGGHDVSVIIHGQELVFPKFIFMLVGFIPWFFISDSINKGSREIRSNRQFVTKINFPVSTILTYTSVARVYIHLMLAGIMFIIISVWRYCEGMTMFSWYELQFFFYLPIMFMFFLSLSWSTATLCCFSRDLENAISSFMTGVFWLSGIIYNTYDLPEPLSQIMLFNPINFFVNGYRNCFLYGRGFWEYKTELVIFLVEFAFIFFIGIFNYHRLRKKIPDVL